MRKILSVFAALLVTLAVSATPVVLPATLDVTNVSFRSEGMPDFVLEEGDYAGTYFDMGPNDSSNDTLLYAEWDVTIQSLKYNIAVDMYCENSWSAKLFLLNQAGDTVKNLHYTGHWADKGQFAIGSIDMSDLEAGNYKLRARCATAWSTLKLKDIIVEADYKGVSVALPGTLQPAYAELSANASVTNNAIAFKPSTAPDEYAIWNVSFAQAGEFGVKIDYDASNTHTYSVALLSADGLTGIDTVAEASTWAKPGVKDLGALTVPAAGNYKVKLMNATQWSEAVLNSITFVAPQRLYLKPAFWYFSGNDEKFAIWDITHSEWTAFMTLAEDETDIWTVTVPYNTTQVIFARFENSAPTPDWDGGHLWNKTYDLTLEEGEDMYTITAYGENYGPCIGEWSKYTHVEKPKFHISGSMTDWDNDKIAVYDDSYTLSLAAGKHQLKVVDNGNWLGMASMTDTTGGLYPDAGGAICLQLAEAGDVVVTFIKNGDDIETFTVTGNFSAPSVAIAGTMNSWSASPFTPALDKKSASFEFTPDQDSYEFKVVFDGDQWLAKKGFTITRANNSVSGLGNTGEGENITFNPDALDEKYTFTWTYATGELKVTYPAEPKYFITGDSMLVGEAKKWNPRAIKATENSYTFEGLKGGHEYKLKVIPTGSWSDPNYGYWELTDKSAGLYTDGSANVCFEMAVDGDVTVTFIKEGDNLNTFTITGDYYVPGTKTVKFVPWKWAADEAKFAAVVKGVKFPESWTPFFSGSGDTLSVEISERVDSIKFVRIKKDATAPNWDDAMNNTGKSDSINSGLVYTINNWWGGTWNAYTPSITILGQNDSFGTDIVLAFGADKLKPSKKVNMTRGTYEFKVVVDGGWYTRENGGSAYELHRDHRGVANVNSWSASECIKVNMDMDGEYEFTWLLAKDSLHVDFPELPDPIYFLTIGIANDDKTWNNYAMSENAGIWSIEVTLDGNKDDYAFKIFKNWPETTLENQYFGAEFPSSTMTFENHTGWTLTSPGNDIGLETTYSNAYEFEFDPSDNTLNMTFPSKDYPTAIDNTNVDANVMKRIENGQLIIIKNGVRYNAQGAVVE